MFKHSKIKYLIHGCKSGFNDAKLTKNVKCCMKISAK